MWVAVNMQRASAYIQSRAREAGWLHPMVHPTVITAWTANQPQVACSDPAPRPAADGSEGRDSVRDGKEERVMGLRALSDIPKGTTLVVFSGKASLDGQGQQHGAVQFMQARAYACIGCSVHVSANLALQSTVQVHGPLRDPALCQQCVQLWIGSWSHTTAFCKAEPHALLHRQCFCSRSRRPHICVVELQVVNLQGLLAALHLRPSIHILQVDTDLWQVYASAMHSIYCTRIPKLVVGCGTVWGAMIHHCLRLVHARIYALPLAAKPSSFVSANMYFSMYGRIWNGVLQVPHFLTADEASGAVKEPATLQAESGDLINHSCNPNAGMRDSVTVVALRDITSGEEACMHV